MNTNTYLPESNLEYKKQIFFYFSIFVRLDQTVHQDTLGFQDWVELVLKLET